VDGENVWDAGTTILQAATVDEMTGMLQRKRCGCQPSSSPATFHFRGEGRTRRKGEGMGHNCN